MWLISHETYHILLLDMDLTNVGTPRRLVDGGCVVAYGVFLLEMGVAHDHVIYNGMQSWPYYFTLTCFPHGDGSSTMEYLLGHSSFTHRVVELIVPPHPLGANHMMNHMTYIYFNILNSSPSLSTQSSHTLFHFDHNLDGVYEFHLY